MNPERRKFIGDIVKASGLVAVGGVGYLVGANPEVSTEPRVVSEDNKTPTLEDYLKFKNYFRTLFNVGNLPSLNQELEAIDKLSVFSNRAMIRYDNYIADMSTRVFGQVEQQNKKIWRSNLILLDLNAPVNGSADYYSLSKNILMYSSSYGDDQQLRSRSVYLVLDKDGSLVPSSLASAAARNEMYSLDELREQGKKLFGVGSSDWKIIGEHRLSLTNVKYDGVNKIDYHLSRSGHVSVNLFENKS